ncbi:sugar phosphate isomerase/epimerase family protein [Paenibacillus sp. Soil750]|uniref:sugar phosphate isomerase/epimerase family protein n=1 Tax=Paenibacillus sp. Soil750 TaxID=1736398 RepID=UPI0006FB9385|nr:sugar phosphate isomerase/epimerase [Paenibacillus sp. Soil750]KRE64618.1 xylose isomerase [Paenibacillus sp. Soil750]
MKQKFAVQLYTLRNECEQDFPGVLRELKQMGWAGVELAGLHSYSAEEISDVLQQTELQTAGMHVSFQRLSSELESVLTEARLCRTTTLICPSVPHELRNEEGYRQFRNQLNEIAKKVQEDGFTLSFHNHAFEFETSIDGRNALEYLIEPSADNAILAEIDVYWVKKAGKDPAAFIRPYSRRMPTMHVKDMTDDEQQTYAEIGTGVIDFDPILIWGEQNGVEWYVVEQDVCQGNPMDCVKLSLKNLHRIADRLAEIT